MAVNLNQIKVPIAQVGVLLVAMLSGYIWMDARFDRIESNISAGTSHRWTSRHMMAYNEELAHENPTLEVPHVAQILRNGHVLLGPTWADRP